MGKRLKELAAALLLAGAIAAPLGAYAAEGGGGAGSATPAATTEPTATAPAKAASAELQIYRASDLAARIGVLLGDGQGVTEAYLAKRTTRLQGAILTLRLLGKEKEALAFEGQDTFADASSAGTAVRPVLAYLKQHPEMGWSGTGGGNFSPNAPITAQQVYKVMLESLSYRTGTDFAYHDTLSFAASKGLSRAAAAQPFTNRDLAAALIETLQAVPKDGTKPLSGALADRGAIAADKASLLAGSRIDLRKAADGSFYLTDGKGMTLYLFTKDMADLNSCTGACLQNWPVFGADRLLLADGLDGKDFGAFVRSDGTKQITYQGWPLYYWAKDAKPGDTTGDGVGKVWYTVKIPFFSVAIGTDPTLNINYLVDGKGMSLYYFDKDPKGASVCSGDCLVKWPAFHADQVIVPSGLSAADFGEIIRPDGAKQTTYKGYPLYYWYQDAARGDTKGQGVGDVWFLVDPAAFAETAAEKAVPDHATIEMKNYAFSASEITVKAGSTVTFVNRDDDFHNAVAVNGEFRTPLISQGESVTIQLDQPGTYEFYCEPHKTHMKGKIIVQ
ncbi:plastocyanin/azurin family copper-binding protein [Cohnella caldifontis]|uniref:plastocyanin/azurin family copper-binding protein n=1 Tax=Cohnella caldifontis TaxID=3027471 RepID=UPI0023ED0108|nr:plastocyanin/azurin family copper-binding protein [Cohnella sp. YIM B05605]